MGNSASNSSANVAVSLEKQFYRAGEVVKGYVQVEVRSKMACKNVYAKFSGEVITAVRYTTGSGDNRRTHTAHQTNPVVGETLCVASFPGDAEPGLYQFPFQFTLHPSLPSSARSGWGGNEGSLIYGVGVQLERPGFMQWDLVNRTIFEVASAPPPTSAPMQKMDIQDVNMCCCIPKGNMELNSSLPFTVLAGQQAMQLQVSVKNPSSQDISKVAVELVEKVWLSANGHTTDARSVLVATNLQGIPAGSNMEQVVPLGLPPSFPNSTTDTAIMKVSHHIEVRADTPCCITNPALVLPVTLCKPLQVSAFASGLPGPVGGDQQAIPFVQALPYQPNASAMGSPIVVQATVVQSSSPATQATVVQAVPAQVVMGKQENEAEHYKNM